MTMLVIIVMGRSVHSDAIEIVPISLLLIAFIKAKLRTFMIPFNSTFIHEQTRNFIGPIVLQPANIFQSTLKS